MKKYKGHIKFFLLTNSPKFNVDVCKSVQTLVLLTYAETWENLIEWWKEL